MRLRVSILIFLFAGLLPIAAWAQPTPVTSILNGSSDTALEVNHNGSLLAPGTFINDGTENDSIPAEGAGTRMMWYPEKAAFRAGQVGVFRDGTQWNAGKVGNYSVAMGLDTKANGSSATAMGLATIASGASATAMGEGTAAATTASLSIGQFNSANTSSDGTLFVAGNGSSGSRSDAMVLDTDGNLTAAGKIETESAGVELPDGTVLSGNEDLGVSTNSNGAFDLSNDDGVVASGAGPGSIPASGEGTRMMWYPDKGAFRAGGVFTPGTQWNASEIGVNSVAFGRDTKASGFSAVAMGEATTATGEAATAMGAGSRASDPRATAIGDEAKAFGGAATAIGDHARAATDSSLSIGYCNSANFSSDNSLFVAGNGAVSTSTACDSRSDALVLDQSGDLTISGTLTESSDRRLKKDIQPLRSDVLRRLSELRPVRYQFEDESTHPSGEQIGLIAQDVREEFPSLVSEGGGGYLSLAYPKMTAVLLKGIQEQQAQLEKKQAQIDSLKEKVRQIQDVKNRLAALEAERSPSVVAGWADSGTGLMLGFLLGGLLGAGLLWCRRA